MQREAGAGSETPIGAFNGTILNSFFSKQARRIHFPRGIVTQAQEAAEKPARLNATAGIARENGFPLVFPSVFSIMNTLSAAEIADYAPTGGVPELRRLWNEALSKKNPALSPEGHSLPLVTAGLTHGLSIAFDLFADEGDTVFCPAPFWENYELIAGEKRGTRFLTFPFFDDEDRFNLAGLKQAVRETPPAGKICLILNFPHNPTGYSLRGRERANLISFLQSTAATGKKILVVLDDAYFSLFFEPDIHPQSLFPELVRLHENILAVKVDGPTKEYYSWGLRIGFLTVGSPGLDANHYAAFEEKALAAVRTSVSSASRIAQSLLCRLLAHPNLERERTAFMEKLIARCRRAQRITAAAQTDALRPYPFNSGYFLTFRVMRRNAGRLREYLLHEKGIGTVALGDDLLRVTWAAIDEADLEELFREIYAAACVNL